MIDKLLPGADPSTTNLVSYAFSYRSDNGSTYVQTQPAAPGPLKITGNITG
jgi:hypothetical protein